MLIFAVESIFPQDHYVCGALKVVSFDQNTSDFQEDGAK
jgi:hypothetical protein